MDKELAIDVFNADIKNLLDYASGLNDRIMGTPDRYSKLVIMVTLALFGMFRLVADSNIGGIMNLIESNAGLVAIIYGIITIIGLLSLMDVVRSRYQYVRVVGYINCLRHDAYEKLGLDRCSCPVGRADAVAMWSWDSASTYACLTVFIVMFSASWLSGFAVTKSVRLAVIFAFLLVPVVVLLLYRTNIKLKES